MTNDFTKRVLVFGALLGWCAALLGARLFYTHTIVFAFLAWNLVLAVAPAVASWFFTWAAGRGMHAAFQYTFFALWLLFLPNAPYVLTDFQHLGHSRSVPLWYDIALMASCSGTALLLCFVSLADVQAVITRRFSAWAGWALAAVTLLLSGFGIYLGRFLRLNSWDVLMNPLKIVIYTAHWLSNPLPLAEALGVTLTYGIMLLLGYVALRVMSGR